MSSPEHSTKLVPRVEELVDIALNSWLPLVGSRDPVTAQTALRALSLLAQMSMDAHQDRWLYDLMLAGAGRSSNPGFLDLTQAISANAAGDPVRALRFARRAAALMKGQINPPGWLRAELEEMYAFQRLSDARNCLAAGQSLAGKLAAMPYPWLDAQMAIEEAICKNMRGQFSSGHQALRRALDVSGSHKYGILNLRAIGIQASFYTDIGNMASAWKEDRTGLIAYWNGAYPPQRAFQFYADLAILAQKQNRWNSAAILEREAAMTIALTPNRSVEAMAWERYGSLVKTTGQTYEAKWAFERADTLFSQLPQDLATRVYRLDCELNLAVLEAEKGDVDAPLQRLLAAEGQVLRIPNITVRRRFYQTLGMLEERRGRYAAATKAYHAALAIGNAGFRVLGNERERLSWEQETNKTYRGLVNIQFRRQHEPLAALRLWRSYREGTQAINRGLVRHRSRGLNPSWPLSGKMPARAVLTYAAMPEGIIIWVTNGRRMASRWISTDMADFEQLVDRFAAECSDPSSRMSDLQRDGRHLYQLLIEPIADYLDAKESLVIETDGIIGNVPMQALTDAHGNFLGIEHALVLSLTTVAPDWNSSKISSNMSSLIVGAPALSPELVSAFPPLSNALREAETIAGLFGRPKLLTREDATLDFVSREIEKAELFHFAGHALFMPDGGRLLLAGPGGVLDPKNLAHLHCQRLRTVILSSCSPEGEDEKSASIYGLIRAFTDLGANEVVAARWNVESAPTQIFMERFYQDMLRGDSVATALQRTAQMTIEQQATSHPYYWAAFNIYAGH